MLVLRYYFISLSFLGMFLLCQGEDDIFTNPQAVVHRIKRQATTRKLDCDLADIVFVLDSSGSIGQENWFKVLNFTKEVVSAFDVGPQAVQIGANYYGNKAHLAFHLNTYNNTASVLEAIDTIPWKDQETNTSGGIFMMHEAMFLEANGARRDVPWLGIVITDGKSNRDPNNTIPQADIARNKNIMMLALGIGTGVSQDELAGIGNKPAKDFVFTAGSFEALDSIREKVVTAACQAVAECYEDGDIVFILDSSGSIGRSNFAKTKSFAEELVFQTNIDTGKARLGLITYSSVPQLRFKLNVFLTRQDMINAISALEYTPGTTNTADAIRMAKEQLFQSDDGDRPQQRNLIVLFTDGSSDDFDATVLEARNARKAGITILVVAVTNWVNRIEINEIASDPDNNGNVFFADSFKDLLGILDPLRRTLCNDNNECKNNPCLNGGTCRNLINTYVCVCPAGFAGIDCQYECRKPADIVFVIDSSNSVGNRNYYAMQNFAKFLIRSLSMRDFAALHRIGLETFAGSTRVRVRLNEYTDLHQMAESVSFRYMDGTSNMAEALRIMRTDLFTSGNGDRRAVRNVGIVLSDGLSVSRTASFREAVAAHSAQITIVGIGVDVKGEYSRRELRGLTTDPDDSNYMEVEDNSNLLSLVGDVVNAVCDNVNECDTSPCEGGGTCVDQINSYECLCTNGRSGRDCELQCDGKIDVAFVIDSSGSIRSHRFTLVLDFVRNITRNLEVRPGRTRVAAITFAENAVIRFHLNAYEYKTDVLHATEIIPYTRGRTNTADAMRQLRQTVFIDTNGDRFDAPNIAIVITDGRSTVNPEDTIPKAVEAREAGIHIIVVSVQNDPTNLELKGIASKPAENNIINIDRFQELTSNVNNVVSLTCNDVDECGNRPCQSGGTCIDGMRTYTCQCFPDYTGINCERRCSAQKDVVFVLDASGSVDNHFELAQRLTERIVAGLNFQSRPSRVGIITFQTSAQIEFILSKYTSKEQVLNAIGFTNNLHIIGTNTYQGLDRMRRDMFTSLNGDRPGVANVAIVMSDGRSNINQASTISEAENARRDGIRVMAVGIGNDVNFDEINGVANDPDNQNAFFLGNQSELDTVSTQILNQLCV